jgi:hypothetical protein
VKKSRERGRRREYNGERGKGNKEGVRTPWKEGEGGNGGKS